MLASKYGKFCIELSELCQKYKLTLEANIGLIHINDYDIAPAKFICTYYDGFLLNDIANFSLFSEQKIEEEYSLNKEV